MSLTTAMSVAQLLKKETFDTHTKAEKILAPKLASIKTYSDYARILKLFYGFFHPLEKQIIKFINQEILTDTGDRRNSLLILKDLNAIDHPTKALPICGELPKINSSLEALGTMYVLGKNDQQDTVAENFRNFAVEYTLNKIYN